MGVKGVLVDLENEGEICESIIKERVSRVSESMYGIRNFESEEKRLSVFLC